MCSGFDSGTDVTPYQNLLLLEDKAKRKREQTGRMSAGKCGLTMTITAAFSCIILVLYRFGTVPPYLNRTLNSNVILST